MRTLSATLAAAQYTSPLDILAKIQLTSGANDVTYERDKILSIVHTEEQFSQRATVVLENASAQLISRKGYKAVISYGLKTSAGEEYSACAPLWVRNSSFSSAPGVLRSTYHLWGMCDKMEKEKASHYYATPSTDQSTIKTHIANILWFFKWAGSAFAQSPQIDYSFDSDDSLIDTFYPKDWFLIYPRESRLNILKKLLAMVGVSMRAGNDTKLHFFVPHTASSVTVKTTQSAGQNSVVIQGYYGHAGPLLSGTTFTIANVSGTYTLTTSPTITAGEATLVFTPVLTQEATAGAIVTIYDAEYQLSGAYAPFFNKLKSDALITPNNIKVSLWDKDNTNALTALIATQSGAGSSTLYLKSLPASSWLLKGGQLTIAGVTGTYTITTPSNDAAGVWQASAGGTATITITPVIDPGQTAVVDAVVTFITEAPSPYFGYDHNATDWAYDPKESFYKFPVLSNAQCEDLADAILAKFDLHTKRGSLLVPQNAGQEIYDYVKVVDGHNPTDYNIIGNIGRLTRYYTPKNSLLRLSFGNSNIGGPNRLITAPQDDNDEEEDNRAMIRAIAEQLKDLLTITEAQGRQAEKVTVPDWENTYLPGYLPGRGHFRK